MNEARDGICSMPLMHSRVVPLLAVYSDGFCQSPESHGDPHFTNRRRIDSQP